MTTIEILSLLRQRWGSRVLEMGYAFGWQRAGGHIEFFQCPQEIISIPLYEADRSGTIAYEQSPASRPIVGMVVLSPALDDDVSVDIKVTGTLRTMQNVVESRRRRATPEITYDEYEPARLADIVRRMQADRSREQHLEALANQQRLRSAGSPEVRRSLLTPLGEALPQPEAVPSAVAMTQEEINEFNRRQRELADAIRELTREPAPYVPTTTEQQPEWGEPIRRPQTPGEQPRRDFSNFGVGSPPPTHGPGRTPPSRVPRPPRQPQLPGRVRRIKLDDEGKKD